MRRSEPLLLAPPFERLLTRLRAVPDGDYVELVRRQVPRPPAHLDVADVVVSLGTHSYNNYRVDLIHVYATPATLARIGLLVLADVLHPSEAGVELRLVHPRSTIRRWRLRSHATRTLGLVLAPVGYGYAPAPVVRHPWSGFGVELPHFELTNAEESLGGDEDWAHRDVVVGCGLAEGAARFAALLLDLGRPGNTRDEVNLECDAGFGSVAVTSAELTLWLPGSIGYDCHGDLSDANAARSRGASPPRARSRRRAG